MDTAVRMALLAAKPAAVAVPLPISLGAALWLDFSDKATLFQSGTRAAPGTPVAAAGDPVGLVLDKSGNQLDFVQATSGKRPLWQASGGILFDSVDDYLSCASAIAGNNQSLIVTATPNVGSGSPSLWNEAVSANDRISIRASGANPGYLAYYHNGSVNTGKQAAGSQTRTTITAEIDKATPTVGLRTNGATSATANSTNIPGTTVGMFLGSKDAVSGFFSGTCFGLIQLARAISAAERTSLEAFLA